MRVRQLHPWDVSPAEAAALQRSLVTQVICEGSPQVVRWVAGADIAFLDGGRGRQPSLARCAVVVLSYPELQVVERHVLVEPVSFPYVPGLLAFREAPILTRAFERLDQTPDLLLVDGHGISHPRRFGLACHLGLILDLPTIGVAKSRLAGEHFPVGEDSGALTDLRIGGETVGAVLRTRVGTRPVYVSVGHRIGLPAATEWAHRLCTMTAAGTPSHRLPEPLRIADRLSKGLPVA